VTIALIIILAATLVALAVAVAFGVGMWRDVDSITTQLAFIRRNATEAQLTLRRLRSAWAREYRLPLRATCWKYGVTVHRGLITLLPRGGANRRGG
jgi:hypothetical protein